MNLVPEFEIVQENIETGEINRIWFRSQTQLDVLTEVNRLNLFAASLQPVRYWTDFTLRRG